MRTLLLLLLLLNFGFLFWQIGEIPWLPWQPDSFQLKSEPIPPLASNLPELVLLNEFYNTSNSTEKTVTNFADISTEKKKVTSTENTNQTQNQQLVEEKNAKPIIVSSTLQQVAGINLTSHPSKPDVLNNKRQSVLAQQITQHLPTQLENTTKSMTCFEVGPYSTTKIPQNMANWLKNSLKNIYAETQTRKQPELQATWVYLPPFENSQVAQRTLQRLKAVGVRKDYGLVQSGTFKNAISLGLYRQPLYVKQRIEELRTKGYPNVKTQKRYRNQTKYWLNVKILSNAQNQLKETFRKKFPENKLVSMTCE